MTSRTRLARQLVTLGVSCAVAMALLAATPAHAVSVSAESRMVDRINTERAWRGLPRLTLNLQMVRLGREWARTMAARNRLYHRPDLADQIYGRYRRVGENVGTSSLTGATAAQLVDRLHNAFMLSSGHRMHILGSYNQVGVGIHRARNGAMWVAVYFLQGPLDGFPLYRDIDGSTHERTIGRMYFRGVVNGCTSARYCPGSTAKRRVLARVVNRATGTRRGTRWLAARCDGRRACMSAGASRRDTARAFAYARRLQPVRTAWFLDVSGGDARVAESVIRAGIMGHCSPSRFCPGRGVSRASLARFAARARR